MNKINMIIGIVSLWQWYRFEILTSIAINLNIEGADAALTLSWLYVRPLILKDDASISDQYSVDRMGGGIVPIVPVKNKIIGK